jgi:hypothetical protein
VQAASEDNVAEPEGQNGVPAEDDTKQRSTDVTQNGERDGEGPDDGDQQLHLTLLTMVSTPARPATGKQARNVSSNEVLHVAMHVALDATLDS